MRRAVVGEIIVLGIIIIGALAMKGLMIGDLQWEYYTNRGQCDSRHKIVTWLPVSDKVNGGFNRTRFVVPCDKWPKKK